MTTHALTDATVLRGRSLCHITRRLDTIITTAITPIAPIASPATSGWHSRGVGVLVIAYVCAMAIYRRKIS